MNWLLALRRHDQGILTKADCGVLRTGKDIASGTGGEGWVEPLNGLDVEIVGRACVAFFIDECIAIRRLNNLDVVDASVPLADDSVPGDMDVGNLNHLEVAVRARKRCSVFTHTTGFVHINHGLATDEGHRGRSDDPHRPYLSVKLLHSGIS
jgi:hypothetical protein